MRIAYASIKAFKDKASLLESLLKLKRRESLEVLSKISGYTSFHETSHSDVTVGSIPTADQVAGQICQVRPDLSETRAYEVANALALHLGPWKLRGVGDVVQSARLWEIGVPPAVAPGQVGSFAQDHRHGEHGFTEGSFAGHFKLTAYEARALLDTYASEGLATYAGVYDGDVRWRIAREGATVFRMRKWDRETAQWTKSAMAEITEKLRVFAQTSGVEEVSIAGGPVRGERRGTLVVGLRVSVGPYTVPEHKILLEQVLNMRAIKAPLSILLFKDMVPERLRRRLVIDGQTLRESTAALTEIDHEERVHQAALLLIAPPRYGHESWSFMADIHDAYFVGELDRYVGREMALYSLPIGCCRAPNRLNDVGLLLAEIGKQPTYMRTLERRRSHIFRSWRSAMQENWMDEMVARAEFALLSLPFPKFCEMAETRDLRALDITGFFTDEEAGEAVAAVIVCRWEKLSKLRAAKVARREEAKKSKAGPVVDYMAAFDCLNFTEPVLVGFVRQPGAHSAHLNHLEQDWDHRLRRAPDFDGRIGAELQRNNFYTGALSIFYRPATEDEVVAFEEASKGAGGTLAYIIRSGQGSWRGVRSRNRWMPVDLVVSPTIVKARYPAPVRPKLLVDDRVYGAELGLFEVFDKLPRQQRLLARKRFLDARTVTMKQFVDANLVTPQPAVVFAAGLENWKFEPLQDGWTGTLSGVNWKVMLREQDGTLTATFQVDGASYSQRLAPLPKEDHWEFMKPYEGILSQLLGFMQRLQEVPTTATITRNPEYPDKSPIELLVSTADYYLHGGMRDLLFREGTSWPRIDTRVAE
jgi:hypothetical protein